MGEFCFTLIMTDVYSGFTINRSVSNKAAIHGTAAIDDARKKFPFPVLNIDSDIQRERIHQRPPVRCLHGEQAHVHEITPLQQERRGIRRAEELDPCPRAGRLPALRHRSRDRALERVALTKATTPLPRNVNRAFNPRIVQRFAANSRLPVPGYLGMSQRIAVPGQCDVSQWGTGRVRARLDAWIRVHPVARGSREDNGVHRCRVPGGSDPAGTRQETRWFRRPAQTTNDRATARPKS